MATTKKANAADEGLSAQERAAVKERAKEVREQKRGTGTARREKDLAAVLAAIEEMPPEDRAIAARVHEIVTEVAPELAPKTWYGMPGYAKDGKVLCFVQGSAKFGTRYCTLGFNDNATLDDGDLWPTAYAIADVTARVEATVRELVAKAAGA